MALPGLPGPYVGNLYTKAASQVFIPEIWISMVRYARDAKLLATRYTMAFPIQGQKGDRYHLPVVGNVPVQDKLPETPITLTVQSPVDYAIDVTHDKVTAFGVENIVDIQSKYPLMKIYGDRHGYALARWVDNEVLGMRAAIYNIASQNVFVSSTGTIAGNGQAFNLAGYLTAKTILDNADVPDEDRGLLVSPNQHNAMIGQQFFASRDYVGESKPVVSGIVGTILGVPVVMTSQIKENSTTGFRNGDNALPSPSPGVTGSYFLPMQDAFTSLPLTFTGNGAPVHTALYCHKEWLAVVLQWKPGASQSFENLLQTNAVVYRQTYGMKIYRPDHAVLIHTSGALS